MSDVPLLQIDGLSRRGNGQSLLLDEISLSISAGERWTIAGESGSGKTVLLRALAMLDSAEGRLLWRGEPVASADIPAYRQQVIYLAQNPAVIEGTVEDNLRFPLSLHCHRDLKFDREWFQQQLQEFRKPAYKKKKKSGDLSGGEKQLVALLRTLPLQPHILLLDEATSALDPASRQTFESTIDAWLAENPRERAVVWVSHDEEQRHRVADRVLTLSQGRIQTETA